MKILFDKRSLRYKKYNMCRQLLFCVIIIIASIFLSQIAYADKQDTQTIKVGFFNYAGYHMIENDGYYSGYGYDFLQLVARYENVKYEYMGYEKSWTQMQKMLLDGEMDLVTSIRKTPEYMDKYDFSERHIGYISTVLTIKAGNVDIVKGEYDTYDGITVGMVENNSRNEGFENFAQEKGFSYTAKYYDNIDEVTHALKSGEVDACVTSELRNINEDEWKIESFDQEKIYAIVKKGNEDVIRTIDDAMVKIDRNEENWRSRLLEKYYGTDSSNELNLNAKQREYIADINKAKKCFKVLVNPDRYPYSYYENGEIKGILVDIFEEIARRAGIKYDVIDVKTRTEYNKMLVKGNVDICMDLHEDFSTAEKYGYKITDTYLSADFAWIQMKDFYGEVDKIARIKYATARTKEWDTPEGVETIYYDTHDKCVDAVRKGKVDAYCTYAYRADKIIWDNIYNDLKATKSFTQIHFNIGVAENIDNSLVNILNSSVHSIEKNLIQEISRKHTRLEEHPFSIGRLVYDYPYVGIGLIFGICLIVFLVVYAIMQFKYQKELKYVANKADMANEAKTEFLARMSHDIRTPINGIIGMVDIADKNIADANKVGDCLAKMRGAIKHLLDLVNDVLDMSKLESKCLELSNQPFNMKTQLEACATIIEGRILSRDILFEVDIEEFEHPFVIGAELELHRILVNILGNAVKYTQDGGGIRYSAKEIAYDNEKVSYRIVVEDDGIGMSEEFQQHIFETFTQEIQGSGTTFEGTGLGMSIAKKLIDQMDGTIEIESEQGVGSVFIITLSFKINKNPENIDSNNIENECKYNLKGKKVLVVDDIELNLEIIKTILEDEDVDVSVAMDGKEAVDIFRNSKVGAYDLIIMDVRMPLMDGLEATKAIRDCNDRPDGATIPIVAMSANAYKEDVEKSLKAGMNGHLNKPINTALMLAEIDKYCNNKNQVLVTD